MYIHITHKHITHMKTTSEPNMAIMSVGTIGVMAPLYAMLFEAITPVAAATIVVPSFFIFMASFIVKK